MARTILDWFAVNLRTIARLVAVLLLYVLVKWFPSAAPEKELLEAATEILGLGVLALTPGLRKPKRKDDL